MNAKTQVFRISRLRKLICHVYFIKIQSIQIQNCIKLYKTVQNRIKNNFKAYKIKMSEKVQQELTQYQKYRLTRLANNKQDDNLSAHFSNISGNISFTKSQRDINIQSYRSNNENQEDIYNFHKEINQKNQHIQLLNQQYLNLERKFQELTKSYFIKAEEADKFKKLYELQINREKQTKLKLKNWVKQAKTNLNT